MPSPATPSDIWRCFAATAEDGADAVALRWGDRAVSFGQLRGAAEERSRELAKLGVRGGDLVAVTSPDPVAWLTLLLATLHRSAAALLLAPAAGAHVLRSVLETIRVDWLVLDEAGSGQFTSEALGGRPLTRAGTLVAVAGATGRERRPETLAIVKLSSGSTAEPKAIAIDAAAVLAEARTVSTALALGPGSQIVCPVPLHHSYGFDLAVLPLATAGATVVVHTPLVPARLVAELGEPATRVLLGVPALYEVLVETPLDPPPELSHVDYLLSCTAPLGVATIERFHARFELPICQHYGASEVGAVTTHVPAQVLDRPRSVGRAMPGVTIEIVDGEVVVGSAALASGYLSGGPEPSPFRGGRFHMGDDGRLDDDGFLTVTGRRDALVNVGGLKVSPEEVRLVLEQHPAVREAAVRGRGDGRGGEFVEALVSLRTEASELDLIRFCRGRLEEFKVPRRVEIHEDLPRLPSGKVDLRRTG